MQINEDVLWWCCTTWSITTLFFLVLICSQIQTSHIQKAKEGSMIHKPPRRGPKKVKKKKKKPFSFAPCVNRGHFPKHSIFNYTEVEQGGQVSLRGEAMKAAPQLNMCTREISSLPPLWEARKGCTYRWMRRKKSLQVLRAHVALVQRHTLPPTITSSYSWGICWVRWSFFSCT